MVTTLALAGGITGAVVLPMWLAWLWFCWSVFKRTGDPASFHQAAVIARVFFRRRRWRFR